VSAPKTILFDFDGTLADSFVIAVGIFNQLSSEFGYRPVQDAEIPAARKMGARQVMQEFGIRATVMPALAQRGLRLLHERIADIKPFAGIPEVLSELKSQGHRLGILTSNSKDNVTAFLKRHDLEIFEFICSSSRLFGKAREIRRLLKEKKISPQEVIFIGDECRDIEAGHKAGIQMIAVTWGYNTPEALAALRPALLVDHPEEIPVRVSRWESL